MEVVVNALQDGVRDGAEGRGAQKKPIPIIRPFFVAQEGTDFCDATSLKNALPLFEEWLCAAAAVYELFYMLLCIGQRLGRVLFNEIGSRAEKQVALHLQKVFAQIFLFWGDFKTRGFYRL